MKGSGIGGQAVMEGVMMKNKDKYAVAVRKPDGTVVIDVQESKPLAERAKFFGIPIIRGMVAFVESMVVGVKTLTYSASFFEDEEDSSKDKKSTKKAGDEAAEAASEEKTGDAADSADETKAEEKAEDKKPEEVSKEDKKKKAKENAVMAGTVCLSIVLAVAIFMLLPYFLSRFLSKLIASEMLLALLEGVIRVVLFVGYIAAISCMSDIKRVFMYHGAEHKSINCVEHGFELTVENVRQQSREHKRCGTSFLLIVMVISVLFFMFIRADNAWLRLLLRLALIPVIAGISYEFIRLAGRTDNRFITALSKPGLLLQKLTTREPDDSMIEVAIASVEAVFDWKEFLKEYKEEEEKEKILAEAKRVKEQKEKEEREAEEKRRAAEEQKEREEREAAEKKAREEREAAEKKAREEREAAEKKEREEREAAEKKAREEKEAEEKRQREAKEAEEAARRRFENMEDEDTFGYFKGRNGVPAELKAEGEARAAEEKAEAEEKAAAEAEKREAEEKAKAETEKQEKGKKRGRKASEKKNTGDAAEQKPAEEITAAPVNSEEDSFRPAHVEDDEDDEILKALDKYFVLKQKKDSES